MSETAFVLNFECSKEEMVRRLLKRASLSGRSDDNMEVIQKRLKAHYSQTKLVLDEFRTETKVHEFNGDETPETIFSSVRPIFE